MHRGGWTQIPARLEKGSCQLPWYEERVASVTSRDRTALLFVLISIVIGHACLATTIPRGSPNTMHVSSRGTKHGSVARAMRPRVTSANLAWPHGSLQQIE